MNCTNRRCLTILLILLFTRQYIYFTISSIIKVFVGLREWDYLRHYSYNFHTTFLTVLRTKRNLAEHHCWLLTTGPSNASTSTDEVLWIPSGCNMALAIWRQIIYGLLAVWIKSHVVLNLIINHATLELTLQLVMCSHSASWWFPPLELLHLLY